MRADNPVETTAQAQNPVEAITQAAKHLGRIFGPLLAAMHDTRRREAVRVIKHYEHLIRE